MAQARRIKIDPITLEVVVEALLSIVREMRVTIIRTAHSSVVCQGHDFSCCLFDTKGQLVAQSEDLPGHVLPMSWSIRALMKKYQESMEPGDVFILNDPTSGGTHLNDVMVAMPVFREDRLFLIPAIRVHWVDVGGMVPGSLSGGATEIHQEGVIIPPIRVYSGGKPNQAALDLLFSNVRLPEDRKGDFRACLAGCRQAELRIHELLERYSNSVISGCIERSLDRAEERVQEQIEAIPQGTYFYEDYLESFENGQFVPVRGCLTLEIKSRSVTADFTGTSPQVSHPINASLGVTASGVFIPVKAIFDPDFPVNHGVIRPVELIVPKGTIMNATYPAPVGGFVELRKRVISLVMGALAQAIPERIAADQYGTTFHNMIGGRNPRTERPFVYYEWPKGGNGAYQGSDGQSAMAAFDEGDTRCIHSAEALETEFPVRMEESALRCDSGGAGRWRGGLGLKRRVRLLCPGTYSLLSDRAILPSYGLQGGGPGRTTEAHILRKGRVIRLSTPGKEQNLRLLTGDCLVMQSGGGAGYGDPLKRFVGEVEADLTSGYISRREAEDRYGVILDRHGRIDSDRTLEKRRELRSSWSVLVGKGRVSPSKGLVDGKRICIVSRILAARWKVKKGETVELQSKKGIPLRLWISIDSNSEDDRVVLDPVGRSVLGVRAGDSVRVRKLES